MPCCTIRWSWSVLHLLNLLVCGSIVMVVVFFSSGYLLDLNGSDVQLKDIDSSVDSRDLEWDFNGDETMEGEC